MPVLDTDGLHERVRDDWLSFCQEHGIVLLAFAPLGHASTPNVLEDPVITAIAARLNMTPAQVALSWGVQRGTALLTTSTKSQRIHENFEKSSGRPTA
jgi:alcohol dehydrogenase (NADP+)